MVKTFQAAVDSVIAIPPGLPLRIQLLIPWGPWQAGAVLFLQDGLYRDPDRDVGMLPSFAHRAWGVLCEAAADHQDHAA